MSNFPPTAEQQAILDAFETGDDIVIKAGAGAGKTSTLVLCAEQLEHNVQGLYIAFNKSIAEEARARFAGTPVIAKTANSLAYGAVGYRYGKRLNAGFTKFTVSMDVMGLREVLYVTQFVEGSREVAQEKVLTVGNQVKIVNGTLRNFAYSLDTEIQEHHVPWQRGVDWPGAKSQIAARILPAAKRAWEDICVTDEDRTPTKGLLKFQHDYYVKLWIVPESDPNYEGPAGIPTLPYDVIFFDEAQDANPILAALVNAQDRSQRVVVGDSAQQIYGWRGAVDALDNFPGTVLTLSESFRFGPEIAEVANSFLEWLDQRSGREGLRIVGRGAPGVIDYSLDGELPDAILCRTNGGVLQNLISLQAHPEKPIIAVIGGSTDYLAFFESALKIQTGQKANHHDLCHFSTWDEVLKYVDEDPEGDDIRILVEQVETYGAQILVDAMKNTGTEANADIVLSTAHKAKGREWKRVRIHFDFDLSGREDKITGEWIPPADELLRLAYVAVTRARRVLNPGPLGSVGTDSEYYREV